MAGAAVAGLPGALDAAQNALAGPGGKSRVIVATDPSVFGSEGEIAQGVLDKMLGRCVAKLTSSQTAVDGWKKLFKPTDVVGIKVNCLFGKGVSTRPEVAMAIVNGLMSAGVEEENIIVWDRSSRDLIKSGYKPNKDGAGLKCLADDGDWGELIERGAFKGRITKIISEKVTAFINAPILKTHRIAGVSIALKNHYGSFDNPGSHHDNNCNPALADFSSIPVVKEKTRLVVVDALRAQHSGGPSLKPDAQWDFNSLIMGDDPVAVDSYGLRVIQEKRKELGLDPLDQKLTAWLESAQERGVGTCDPDRIQVVNV